MRSRYAHLRRRIIFAILKTVLLTFPVQWLHAECRALVRIANNGGLWIATPQGGLVRRLTTEWVSHAAWSPDGRYIACAYGNSGFALMNSEGRSLSRKDDREESPGVDCTGIGWAEGDVLWLKASGHANSLFNFIRVPRDRDLNHAASVGAAFGSDCKIAPDLKLIACTEGSRVALTEGGQNGLNDRTIYPATFLDPSDRIGVVDLNLGQAAGTHTEPAFELRILSVSQERIRLRVTPPDGNWHEGYLKGDGDFVSYELEDAYWLFALRALDTAQTHFRVTVFKDDRHRELAGISWDPDGSRLLTFETTRRGNALVILSRSGGGWEAKRLPIQLTDEVYARRFASDGGSAILESLNTSYRCTLADRPTCRPVDTLLPRSIAVRLENYTVQGEVMDWYCTADP
jgi:dipeptidyl aminopeptidase/acylaminoacyl peptidase